MPARTVAQPLPTFRPLVAPRGLTEQLVARIGADITGGRLPPGSKLPTEKEMMAATGVSRTVVREAVACLRADGLVVVRQGVGAFVAEHVRRPFRIEVDELDSLREALDVMELRAGVEIEAAGLAAERHNGAHIKKIAEAYRRIEDAIGRGESAVDEDFSFHCSIADATGNAQFKRFLDYLGRFIIPRQSIRKTLTPDRGSARLSQAHSERAHGNPRGHPCRRGGRGARRDAASPRRQPQALSKTRRRDRRRSGGHSRVVVNFASCGDFSCRQFW